MPDAHSEEIPYLPDDRLLPPEDIPFENREEEALFHQALAPFRDPAGQPGAGRWLLITVLLFVAVEVFRGQGGFDVHWLAILLGTIFLHEMGHYFGMVLFGYRDVRMFFVPFFGAAVSGRKHGAPAWQQLIVVFLGPLPGIVLAGVLYAFARPDPDVRLREAIYLLIGLNGLNLLPLLPLDGGRIVNLLLFSRHAVLESLFQLFAVLGLAALGYAFGGWILYGLAVLMFLAIPHQYRLRRMAAELRADHPEMPAELADLSPEEERRLFRRIRAGLTIQTDPKMIANSMRSLHELAVTSSPGLLTTFAFSVLYVVGFLAPLGLVGWMTLDQPPLQVDVEGNLVVVRELRQAAENT